MSSYVSIPALLSKDAIKMLIKYGIKNFLSFKEGAEVSFEFDGNVPNNISGGNMYATIMCVKGANGSGKTHLLKGLAFIANFATRSFSADPNDDIPIDPFFSSTNPTEFYAEFSAANSTTYIYELSVTKKEVLREALYEKKRRKTLLFERINEAVLTQKRLPEIKTITYRKNTSVIATLHQHNNIELAPVYSFFNNIQFNVTQSGYSGGAANMSTTSKLFMDNPTALQFAIDFIKECDVGINNITISSEEGQDGKKNYFPIFHHLVDGQEYQVYPYTESIGTIHLFRMLLPYLVSISNGGLYIADEFDLYLHPDLLPKILNLFIGASNTSGAQLLFSTHAADVVDIAGKYRTCCVNKEHNASYAYRLDEIPGDILRNDRPISTPYREGKIGGVPRL